MERRTLLAVVLSIVVLYVYQAYFLPTQPTPAEQTAATGPSKPEPPPEVAVAPAPTAPAVPVPEALVSESAERDVVIETPHVRAVFTNRGARLKGWVLKGYTDQRGVPVDLVPSNPPAGSHVPFSVQLADASLTSRVNQAIFRVTQEPSPATPAVVFEYEDASGVTARKQFQLNPETFTLAVSVNVRSGDHELVPALNWGPGLGDLGATTGGGFFSPSSSLPPEAIYHNGEDVERIAWSKLSETPVHEGKFRFAGVDDHYFIVAAVNAGQARLQFTPVADAIPGAPEQQRQLIAHSLTLSAPPSGLLYYMGPKSFDTMKAVDAEFVRGINFGIWAWLAVPFLSVLKWIHGYVGNYGWSIIILTILINLVMFPLRHKSVVSMRKMQALQPQLKAIQDRYADLKMTDPARQKMNTEVMNLYREKGVNPASGCIPTLLTFPVLFAFYSLLSQAIELRGAPFAFWIQDLSRHDPYYVTPLLMGATMFWQMWITPSTGDATQQRVMMLMPVIFVAMFLTLPSGLAIYYFVSNLWAIGQQYFTNWWIGPPTVSTPRPAAERRLKTGAASQPDRANKKS